MTRLGYYEREFIYIPGDSDANPGRADLRIGIWDRNIQLRGVFHMPHESLEIGDSVYPVLEKRLKERDANVIARVVRSSYEGLYVLFKLGNRDLV